MNINFKMYNAKEFEKEFTNGKPYFNEDVKQVIVFRPQWDNFGLCFITQSNNGMYSANGCGIEAENLNGSRVWNIIRESNSQVITDDDIRKFIEEFQTEQKFTLSLRTLTRESLADKVIKRFWIEKIYILSNDELDLDNIQYGSLTGHWLENGKYEVKDDNNITIYEGYELDKMVQMLCEEFK